MSGAGQEGRFDQEEGKKRPISLNTKPGRIRALGFFAEFPRSCNCLSRRLDNTRRGKKHSRRGDPLCGVGRSEENQIYF